MKVFFILMCMWSLYLFKVIVRFQLLFELFFLTFIVTFILALMADSQRIRKPVQRFQDELQSPLYVLLFFPIDNKYNYFPSNSHFLPADGSAFTMPYQSKIFISCNGKKLEAVICHRSIFHEFYCQICNYYLVLLTKALLRVKLKNSNHYSRLSFNWI